MPRKLTTEEFIKKAKIIHGDKYDYTLTRFINSKTKVKIICPIHGGFEQYHVKHLSRKGCAKCGFTSRCNKARSNIQSFVNKALNIHGNKYNYDKVVYNGKEEKVIITCQKHGDFHQTPHNHLAGNGCPICRESKGESQIAKWLDDNNIKYIRQHRFPDCKFKLPLPFDFYLPKHNICIEYQGIQHFKPRSKFGGVKEFEKMKERDMIKVKYCNEKGISLLVISYLDDYNRLLNTL